MTHRARVNLAKEKSLESIIGKKGLKWAKRIITLSQLPGMLEEVYASGLEHLPLASTPAPIMAFSHKKFFDVQSIAYFMAGRPINTFHGVTIMSQAGLHSAIYPYSEMIPDYLKNPLTDPFARLAARGIGSIIKDLFSSINTYPVYREGLDVPATKEEYNAKSFGGQKILGMTFDEYKSFAAKKTRQTLMQVFKDIADKNKSFLIAPEGIYCHDGTIQPMEDFIGFAANRKKRNTIATGISYDELCPDGRGRIACYLSVAKEIPPPVDKKEIPRYLENLRATLLDNQTVLASHIIAIILKDFLDKGSFSQSDLLDTYINRIKEIQKNPKARIAPVLLNTKERELKLDRFLKNTGKKWLQRKKNNYTFNIQNLEKFDPLERSVNSLEWNYNQVKHLL